MRGRGGVVLALATIVAAALASTAGAGSSTVARSQAVNCKGTLKIGIITPLTGGAGFLGQEQLSWTRYALATLPKTLGLKVQLVRGDTPVEKGPGEGLVVAQKMIADSRLVAAIGPATSGAVASASKALFAAGHRAHLAVRDADVADPGLDQGGHAGVLPGRPGRLHPGPDRRELHGRQAEREEGRPDRLPGALLRRSRRCGRGRAEAEGRRDDPAVDLGQHDRLLVARHPGAERRGRRLLPDPAAARTRRRSVSSCSSRASGRRSSAVTGRTTPPQFKLNGSYVSNFAPDISGIASSKALSTGGRRRIRARRSARSGRRPTSRRRSR